MSTAVAQHIDERAWLEERRKHLTASEIMAIVGQHPFKTAYQLQQDKLGQGEPVQDNPAMRRGRQLEPVAAELYAEKTGRQVRRQPFRVHPDHPLIACSIDRQILAGKDHGTACLELKVPGWRNAKEYRRNGLPAYIIGQMQIQAAVWGYDFTAMGLLDTDAWEIVTWDVEHDREFTAELIARAEFWWTRHIINREPIELEDPAPLEKLPEVSGEVIQRDDQEFIQASRDLLEARDLAKEAGDLQKAAKDRLIALLGQSFGSFEGGEARIHYAMRPGRKTLDKNGLARVALDPAKVQKLLVDSGFHGAEELLLEHADELRIEVGDFEREGAPYVELRPYRIAPEAF